MTTARGFPAGLALVIAVITVSWGSILVRLSDAPSLSIALYRLLFATLILLPWGLSRRGSPSRSTMWLALAAGAMLALHFASWITSLAFTSVASSVVLVSTAPVFTAVLAPVLLRERPGRLAVMAVLLSLGGTFILVGGDLRFGGRALLGDVLAVTGAWSASLYLIIGRSIRRRISFGLYLVLVYGAATLLLGVTVLASGDRITGFSGSTWIWLVLLAAGPTVVGHGLLNWSVRRLNALTVNLALIGEPVLATLYAAVLFSEVPAPSFYLGGVTIVSGVVLAALEQGRGRR